MATIERLRRRALRALEPPPKLRLSEWIEAEMVLPDGVSALPGRIRLWPFQTGIADAMGDPDLERVTVVKPVRVGYTTLLTSAIGSFIGNDPAPILCVLPTEDDCRDYMVSDVEPIFAATPALARALSDDQEEGERNTIMARRFPGGSLKVVAARSPRSLRRHNVRVLIEDEVDAMETTREGPPDVLAEKRTLSFPNRKIIKGSTPIFAETSAILRAYEQSDKRIFEVPCPECGDLHEILWGDLVWDKDTDGQPLPETAAWCCPSCGSVIPERRKAEMVGQGRWRATAPHVQGHAGFRLSALVSLHANASWPKLVAEFLGARHDPTLLQIFVNTILGQGWQAAGEEIDEDRLMDGAESWSLEDVPKEALALTLGVDVQDDRLECTALGWTQAGAMLVLGHHVIDGRYDEDETWRELDGFLSRRWSHRLGGTIGFDAACVDSGSGLHMPHVLAFCRPRARRRVLAIKGEDGMRRPIIERSRSKARDRLWIVGSDAAKKDLFGRLSLTLEARDAQPRPVRFSDSLPPHWFEQLASERLVVRYSHGRPVHRFERIAGRRAEALDCVVYGMAARQVLTLDWDRRRVDLATATPVRAAQKPRRDSPPSPFRDLNWRF